MTEMTNIVIPEGLSSDLVERYRSQGFVHIPRVLSADEVREFLADARELLDLHEKASWDEEGNGNVMDWVAAPEVKSAVMRRLALHPGITGIAEKLAGQPLRLFKSELLRKRTIGATRTPLHIDNPAFPIAGADVTLTAWVALVDVPAERGCMTFIPGSHVWPEGSGASSAEPFDARPELRWWPQATVPLRAGDCTFHHSWTVHMAGTNETDTARISLATVYMDAAATYHPTPEETYQDEVVGIEPGRPLDTPRYPRVGLTS
ncbi:phytanoyl-CoA dioxygenase family protein [Nocardia sp. NBC_00508]|uniref:phytanoyl-CoA dioxygenase family protein n=1 Tax=Nocardia sp. NBC_00508 TaxID=2975992 RepID=UPI002E81334B|nr:phytanoyl-CoA dioxygenase family protein [Nocardia sp. NBC_00508]WUD63521.1 phytanoyl-CoA dioxygenase family protein [Nocardia sp. NBC_00508]